MKTLFLACTILCAVVVQLYANNPLRKVPYPQQEYIIYLNPAPLLVPYSMKQSDFLQFNLSTDKKFESERSILSKPVPWCVFNPHQVLSTGTWYWRFRSVSKSGEELPWSETYSFTVADNTPQFATPPFSAFMENVPQDWIIEAELNAKRLANLYISNSSNQATFSYGKKKTILNGQDYQCRQSDASVLYDEINGAWKAEEMSDKVIQTMGKW